MPATKIAKRIAARSASPSGPSKSKGTARARVTECAKLKGKEDKLRERREALERKNGELRKEAEKKLKERQDAEKKKLEAKHKAEDGKLAKKHEKEYAAMVLRYGCTPKPRRKGKRNGKKGNGDSTQGSVIPTATAVPPFAAPAPAGKVGKGKASKATKRSSRSKPQAQTTLGLDGQTIRVQNGRVEGL